MTKIQASSALTELLDFYELTASQRKTVAGKFNKIVGKTGKIDWAALIAFIKMIIELFKD